MFPLAKFAFKTHAACDPEARNDTPFDLLAGFAGSFTGPPILSPGIDRGEQQIDRVRRGSTPPMGARAMHVMSPSERHKLLLRKEREASRAEGSSKPRA
jgi:hypothetical protein